MLAATSGARGLLTAEEAQRAGSLRREGDRDDFVAAHALVRVCAGRVLGLPPSALTLRQRCELCGGPHGQPRIVEAPTLGISLSHTRGWVAAIACSRPGGVGVDVERHPRARVDPELLATVLAPRELELVESAADPALAFLRLWVCKESLIKAGVGALDEMAALDLSGVRVQADASGAGLRRLTWGAWCWQQWWHPDCGVVGATVARAAPTADVDGIAPYVA